MGAPQGGDEGAGDAPGGCWHDWGGVVHGEGVHAPLKVPGGAQTGHGDTQGDGARSPAPMGDKPPRTKPVEGGTPSAPPTPRGGHPLPARAQRARRRPRMAEPWGAGAGAPLGRLHAELLGLAPGGMGQLSPTPSAAPSSNAGQGGVGGSPRPILSPPLHQQRSGGGVLGSSRGVSCCWWGVELGLGAK